MRYLQLKMNINFVHFIASYSMNFWHFLFIMSSGLYDDKYEGEQKKGGKGENKLCDND
jgi:hypothetical protein